MFHLKIFVGLGTTENLKEIHWLVIWFELSPFGYENDNCNLQVLQFYAHNICMVYKRYFTNLTYHPFYICSFINNKILFHKKKIVEHSWRQ